MFIEEFKSKNFSIELKMFAHRAVKQLLVTMVTVKNMGDSTLRFRLHTSEIADTEDVEITSSTNDSVG